MEVADVHEETRTLQIEKVDNSIVINFSDYYQRDLSVYNEFSMHRKRNFSNMADESIAALRIICDSNPQFVWGLLSLRYDIMFNDGNEDYVGEDKFAERLYDIFDEGVVAVIREAVSRIYAENNVDINAEVVGKNNEELQFTNDHAHIILCWSMACVASAPIITAYMDYHEIQPRDSLNLIIASFTSLLRRFETDTETTDILAKLRKLVESRVLQTRYSDKVIWSYIKNIAIDPYIFIQQLFRKFIAEGIPKLDQGTNIIKFIHTFIKNQIRFQFLHD